MSSLGISDFQLFQLPYSVLIYSLRDVNRIFFLISASPILTVLFNTVSVSFKAPFFHQFLLIYQFLLDLSDVLVLFFHPNTSPRVFPFLYIFACCGNRFTCTSSLIKHIQVLYFCSYPSLGSLKMVM